MNDLAWRRIEAILSDLEEAARAIPYARQPSDKEAFDTLCRIERKILSAGKKPKAVDVSRETQ